MEEVLACGNWPRKIMEAQFAQGVAEIQIVRHYDINPSYRRGMLKVLIARTLEELTSLGTK